MNDKIKKITKLMVKIGWGIVFLGLFLTEFIIIGGKHDRVKLNLDNYLYNDSGWTVNGEPIFQDSITKFGDTNKPIEIEGTLPTYIADDYAVMLFSEYSMIEAYVDDELIYEYGKIKALPMGNMVGNVRVLIPVDAGMAGKRMDIRMTPYYGRYLVLSAPMVSSVSSLHSTILVDNIHKIIILVLLGVIAILSMLLYIMRRKNSKDSKSILNLAGMTSLVGVWIFCSSDLPQFFTDGSEGIAFASFLSIALVGMPFTAFWSGVLEKKHRVLNIMWLTGWTLPVINILCFVLNIADPITLRPLSYLYLLAICVMAFIFSKQEWNNSGEAKALTITVIVLFSVTVLGLSLFFIVPSQRAHAVEVMGAGCVITFITFLCIMIRRRLRLLEEEKYISTYKTLAYVDAVTRLENRVSFEKEFDSMKENNIVGSTVTLFIFDIDHLQIINDEKGTQAGDMLLIGLADCIHKTFANSGKCFRIGGDEFAVILIDREDQEKGFIKDYERYIEIYNDNHTNTINASYGYEIRKWSDDENFYRDLFRDANLKMFNMKMEHDLGSMK